MKKYEIIIEDIIEKMKKGELKKSSKISSIRQLSREYKCNKDTVIKALVELSQKGLIYSVPKSGYYILKDVSEEENEKEFRDSLPDFAQFPFGDFSMCINQVLDSRDLYLFGENNQQVGLSDLIASFHKLLREYNVYCNIENIVVSSGTQQALYILSNLKLSNRTFCSKENFILIEQPTYYRMNKLVKNLNLPYKTIERTTEGIDLNELEKIFSEGNINFFYTIPRLHYPLGSGYSESEKKKIIELSEKYGVYIIEDDYMADFDTSSSMPLKYYDTSERVIYIKSFSSIIFPALRVASVVIPSEIVPDFLKYKELMDYDSNLILQKALSIYIDNGMFDSNRSRLVSIYKEKQKILNLALEKRRDLNYSIFDTQTVFKLKNSKAASEIKHKILLDYDVDFFEEAYISACPYKYVKIDVRRMTISEIEKNLEKLLNLLENYII